MNDEKKLRLMKLKSKIQTISLISMGITLVCQVFAFNALRHVILCCFILLLIGFLVIIDICLKELKEIPTLGYLFFIWLANIIIILYSH